MPHALGHPERSIKPVPGHCAARQGAMNAAQRPPHLLPGAERAALGRREQRGQRAVTWRRQKRGRPTKEGTPRTCCQEPSALPWATRAARTARGDLAAPETGATNIGTPRTCCQEPSALPWATRAARTARSDLAAPETGATNKGGHATHLLPGAERAALGRREQHGQRAETWRRESRGQRAVGSVTRTCCQEPSALPWGDASSAR